MTLDLYQRVQDANEHIDGWCVPEKSFTLASIIVATHPDLCLEIGLWKGKSFSAMALACKAVNHGLCIGVDPWSRDVAMREQTTPADGQWWADVDFEAVRLEFVANMKSLDVEKFIRIERRESQRYEPPMGIGLASIDGAHSKTALHDMMRVGPKIIMGGFIVTDDTNWAGGGVALGEQQLLKTGFKKLYEVGTGAVFQKVRTP